MICTMQMQEKLALSAMTHRILTLHPYKTRQQTGLHMHASVLCQDDCCRIVCLCMHGNPDLHLNQHQH